jgi:glycosyltransferase involved in cell wall biosynthesis
VALGRAYGKWRAARYIKKNAITGECGVALDYSHKYTRPFMPPVGEGEYDLAISFLTPHYFVAEKVCAKVKLAWTHTDYSRVQVDAASEATMWGRYDRIGAISPAVGEAFAQVFPSLKDKLLPLENILPARLVRMDAQQDVSAEMPEDGSIRLLSVGRYTNAKNFDNVPDICRHLRQMGLNVKWYLIGYGGDENLIRRSIAEAGMEEHVIMLGKRANPYPYMAACDLYVQPSRYEGKAVTVREAQMLGKSVVITRYATSASQLEEDVDGVIVPMDNEGCAAGIAELLRDEAKMERLRETCLSRDYSGAEEVEKIYQLME